MKKLLLVCLLFIMLSANAQKGKFNPIDVNQNFPGFMVTEDYDTIHGTFYMYMYPVMQMGCQMTAADGTGIYGKSWNNVICYQIEGKTKWYSTKLTKLVAPEDKKRSGEDCFVVTVVEGPITIYDYNFWDESADPPVDETRSSMLLPSGEVVKVESMILGFKKKMSAYVADFPDLSKKIAKKEKGYGLMRINDIAREYNEWYLEKNPDFTILKN